MKYCKLNGERPAVAGNVCARRHGCPVVSIIEEALGDERFKNPQTIMFNTLWRSVASECSGFVEVKPTKRPGRTGGRPRMTPEQKAARKREREIQAEMKKLENVRC